MALLNPTRAPARVRRTVSSVAPTVLRALLELGLILAVFELYRAGRLLARGESASAYEHALQVHHLERVLHLPSEATVQGLVPWDSVLHAANIYYFSVHFPTMIAFLVWGYLFRSRAEYRWARNLVIALTCTALVVHIVFPLAPPRMFPQWGFMDTMATFGPNAYAGTSGAMANQFAAMPSLHIGWAALIAYVIHRTGPRWLAWVATGHLAVTVLVVVVTANHYWIDGVVALMLLAGVALVVRHPGPEQGVSGNSWRRRTPPRSHASPHGRRSLHSRFRGGPETAGGVTDPSKTPSLSAGRRLASPRLDDAGIHQQFPETP